MEADPHADLRFMRRCIAEAETAAAAGEVPVGALVVRAGEIIGVGRNSSIALSDPSAHAEIMALRVAGARIGNYRLVDAELFVTVEPCLMCVGALVQARVRRVVFGCRDPKAGALGSIADFSAHPALNHRFAVTAGVCEEGARSLLRDFFRTRRAGSN
jgi:tRNA(Arg) A34 adenosine deaminase TadA